MVSRGHLVWESDGAAALGSRTFTAFESGPWPVGSVRGFERRHRGLLSSIQLADG